MYLSWRLELTPIVHQKWVYNKRHGHFCHFLKQQINFKHCSSHSELEAAHPQLLSKLTNSFSVSCSHFVQDEIRFHSQLFLTDFFIKAV